MLCLAGKGKFCLTTPPMPLGICFLLEHKQHHPSSSLELAGETRTRQEHPSLPSRETSLSLLFSSIPEADSSSSELCQCLWVAGPELPWVHCGAAAAPAPPGHAAPCPRLKAFPLAASLDVFYRKTKHQEKMKPCHFPLQIIQGCNEKESIKAELLGCEVFPVVSVGNSYKSLALAQHHLHRAGEPRGAGLGLCWGSQHVRTNA